MISTLEFIAAPVVASLVILALTSYFGIHVPTNNTEQIDRMLVRLNSKLDKYLDEIIKYEKTDTDDAKIGIVAYGSSARSARNAMRMAREKGIKVGMLRMQTIWPFPTDAINKFAQQLDAIIIPELNLGQLAHEVEHAVKGKVEVHRVNKINGEPIHPKEILEKIEGLV